MSIKFDLRKFLGNRTFLDYSPKEFWKTRRDGRGLDNCVWHNVFVSFLRNTGCKTVLEIGCGTGVNLAYAKLKIPNIECSGFDLSKYHIDLGKEKYGNIKLKTSTIEDVLPTLKDNGFDCVLCSGILMHVSPNKIGFVIKEIKRISSNCVFLYEQDLFFEYGLRHPNNFVFYHNYERLFKELNLGFKKEYGKKYFVFNFLQEKLAYCNEAKAK